MPKQCHCGLINPDSALICDCGHNFRTGINPKQRGVSLPKGLEAFLLFQVCFCIFLSGLFIMIGEAGAGIMFAMVAVILGVLNWRLRAGKTWATIILLVLTFPIGLLLGLGRDL